jgi:hypothetical protein
VYNLFLVYLSISTCLRQLRAHHQEKQQCLCDTWYLLFCVDDCLVCRVEWNKYQVSHKHSCFSWWWAHSRLKHVKIEKYMKNRYTKNKLCTKLALFTWLYRDARSTKHKIFYLFLYRVSKFSFYSQEVTKNFYLCIMHRILKIQILPSFLLCMHLIFFNRYMFVSYTCIPLRR